MSGLRRRLAGLEGAMRQLSVLSRMPDDERRDAVLAKYDRYVVVVKKKGGSWGVGRRGEAGGSERSASACLVHYRCLSPFLRPVDSTLKS